MHSRRKFLLQGSLATTAMIVAKPFQSLASSLSPFTGFSVSTNRVIFLHTGSHTFKNRQNSIAQIKDLQKEMDGIILLHAGNGINSSALQLKYDTLPAEFQKDRYKILHKGHIKIGIVYADFGDHDLVNRINTLSTWLKNEKRCQIVACLSQLGYSVKNALDDKQLALESMNLDVILGGHADNFFGNAIVARNSKKEEVIINYASGKNSDFGNIEFVFDKRGKRKSIAINNLRKSRPEDAVI